MTHIPEDSSEVKELATMFIGEAIHAAQSRPDPLMQDEMEEIIQDALDRARAIVAQRQAENQANAAALPDLLDPAILGGPVSPLLREAIEPQTDEERPGRAAYDLFGDGIPKTKKP